jgi:acyl-CoA synthetase (NDP forming)
MVRSAGVRRGPRPDRAAHPDPDVRRRLAALRQDGVAVTLGEPQGKALVAAMGLPVARGEVVTSPAAATAAAGRIGYPVALKVVSAGLEHKTDAGGVALGIDDDEALTRAWRMIEQRVREHAPEAGIDGFMVEEHVPGVEVLLGLVPDPAFGLMVAVGTGGTLTEVVDDVAVALPPLTRATARGIIDSLRGRALLDGFRGAPPADVDALAGLVVTLSRVAVDYADAIAELDLNPVIFSGGRWRVVDALVRLLPA